MKLKLLKFVMKKKKQFLLKKMNQLFKKMKTNMKTWMIAALMMGAASLTACGGGEESATTNSEETHEAHAHAHYQCPMDCEEGKTYEEPGKCPVCKMDLEEVFDNLGLFAVGIIWMLIHVTILLVVAKLIKAPFFFVAVGSQANVGGAASAPVVASAFSPALAPVGVLMAVLGYALGTYGAIACAILMQLVAT